MFGVDTEVPLIRLTIAVMLFVSGIALTLFPSHCIRHISRFLHFRLKDDTFEVEGRLCIAGLICFLFALLFGTVNHVIKSD
jgi:hypothetical protein